MDTGTDAANELQDTVDARDYVLIESHNGGNFASTLPAFAACPALAAAGRTCHKSSAEKGSMIPHNK